MFCRLMGIEPLNITDRERYRFLGWVLALGMLSGLMPAAHQALGLPQAIALTLQVLVLIGILFAFAWAIRLASRPERDGGKER